jgi:hypothetical protein
MHNQVRHTANMPLGLNGFRAWTDVAPYAGFEPCRCGWSGLAHYSLAPDEPCLTWAQLREGED